VVNARDAMPAGGRITIATDLVRLDDRARGAEVPSDVEPGDYVVLSVADTGTGIPGEVRGRVFEPFFTTKGVGEGTGLGLAMVHGFVAQSGGFVTLESAVERGTSVAIHLPAVSAAEAEPDADTVDDSGRGGDETILLVEDDPAVAAFAAEVLARLGYHVLTAKTGDEAAAIARRHVGSIDLLFADVVMPGLTGPQLAAALLAERPELAVLYASGYSADIIADRDLLDRRVELLEKPYSQEELTSRVRAVLDARSGRRSAGAPDRPR
jgi:CheY-like chemotaxis protein